MKKGVHAFVVGQVQGVGFRYYVHRVARRYMLSGWVRNLVDGQVEIMVEGDENELGHFIDEVKKGSRWSHVDDVKVEWVDYQNQFRSFEITG